MNRLFDFRGGRSAVGLLLLRLVVGAAFVIHGWGKMHSPHGMAHWNPALPAFWNVMAVCGEFCGGLGIIVGLLTPVAAFGIVCVMLVALFKVHIPAGHPFVDLTGGHSYELPATYLAAALAIILAGPGALSLDALVFGRANRS